MKVVEITNFNVTIKRKKTDTVILKNINLHLDEGQWVHLKGRNGKGKTLLCKFIHQSVTNSKELETAGSLMIDNIDVLETDVKKNHKVSMVFQNNQFITSFNVLENLMTPLLAKGVGLKESKEEALDLLKQFNLIKLKSLSTKELSGGQKRMISILMGLIGKPKLLVIDEPFNELDLENIKLVKDYLTNLKMARPTLTVIVVSHQLSMPFIDFSYNLE